MKGSFIMKKLLAMILAVLMLVACFAGCGANTDDVADTAGTNDTAAATNASATAKTLGWDETVWDLSGAVPSLK